MESDLRFDALAMAIHETDESKALWQAIAYFATREHAETARRALDLPEEAIAEIPDVDWVRESLKGLAPVIAGRFFLHGSHDREQRRVGGITLELDAQTAFGTGHHGTTAGCLEAFDAIAKRCKPRRVLDLGCGTGVLAIAAAKLHCPAILATDIDPIAVTVTKANARINSTSLRSICANGLAHRDIRQNAPYDLIFANILARPLDRLATGLVHLLAPQGRVILSGITVDQIHWISACYTGRGLALESTRIKQNWATLVLRQKTRSQRLRASC